PVEATSVLIDAMATGRSRRVGLGLADDRYFLFTAGLGYDAAVVGAVEAHRRRGKTSTHALYVRTAVRTFFTENRRHPQLRLHLPDGSGVDDLYMALVNNCDPWTYLGNRPVSPTPQASFDSGLDVYTRTRMGVAGVLWSASRMTGRRSTEGSESIAPPGRSGTGRGLARLRRRASDHADSQPSLADAAQRQAMGAVVLHDLADFTLTASRPLPFQVDGDALDKRDYVRFREIPRALEVFV